MMNINFNTDRLIIMNYPRGAGGKYIASCLAVNPFVCHMNADLAEQKMKGEMDSDDSFEHTIKPFELKRKFQRHFEYGNRQLSGFVDGDLRDDIKADEIKSNDTYRKLTNQHQYYFCMTDADQTGMWQRYPNRKNIVLTNFDWIHEARNVPITGIGGRIDWNHDTEYDNRIDFDMESFRKDDETFGKELAKVFSHLGLDMIDRKYLHRLRTDFLETVSIGFREEDKKNFNHHIIVDDKGRTEAELVSLRDNNTEEDQNDQ